MNTYLYKYTLTPFDRSGVFSRAPPIRNNYHNYSLGTQTSSYIIVPRGLVPESTLNAPQEYKRTSIQMVLNAYPPYTPFSLSYIIRYFRNLSYEVSLLDSISNLLAHQDLIRVSKPKDFLFSYGPKFTYLNHIIIRVLLVGD